MENIKRMEKPTDEKCERCGSPLVIKWGKHGSFYACSSYEKDNPESCKFTKENPINLPDLDSADVQETTQEEYCKNCGRVMVLKRGRFGQFMACTGYPDCKHPPTGSGQACAGYPARRTLPKCGRNLMIRHGRYGEFTACSGYPDCKFVKQNFIGMKCPPARTGNWSRRRLVRETLSMAARIIQIASYRRAQADRRKMPQLRPRVSGGEASESRSGDCVPEQRVRLRAPGASRTSGSRGSRRRRAPKKIGGGWAGTPGSPQLYLLPLLADLGI